MVNTRIEEARKRIEEARKRMEEGRKRMEDAEVDDFEDEDLE